MNSPLESIGIWSRCREALRRKKFGQNFRKKRDRCPGVTELKGTGLTHSSQHGRSG
jgi:hypothetical protein